MHLFMSFILRAVFMFVRDIIQAVSVNAALKESTEHLDSFISTHNETNIDNVRHSDCPQQTLTLEPISKFLKEYPLNLGLTTSIK